MGLSQEYPHSTAQRKDEVDKAAWAFASAKLGQMRGADAGDLQAAALSYLVQSVQQQSAGGSFSREALRVKADRLAAFWTAKHTANSTKRQHTRYSAEQGARGRVVSQYRRGRASDVSGLLVQLAAKRGAEVGTIAAALGITPQHARRLKRRRFARVLVLALLRTFGKNSLPSPSQQSGTDHKETLPNVRIDGGRHNRPRTNAAGRGEHRRGPGPRGLPRGALRATSERIGPRSAEGWALTWPAFRLPLAIKAL